jgi:hypothetical protein
LFKHIFENNLLLLSLASWELLAVGIVKLSLTITELQQFLGKNLKKNPDNALLEKILKHLKNFAYRVLHNIVSL